MASYIEREKARVAYFNVRSVVRADELVQKESAAEAKDRQEAALLALREAEIQAWTAAVPEGEVLDIAARDREKALMKRNKEDLDFQALEKAVMGDLGLNPDTYVVPVVNSNDVFEEEAAAEAEEKRKMGAAASKRASRVSSAGLNMDASDVEVKE